MFAQESVMDIQKEKIAHEKHLLSQGVDFKYLPNIQYSELENVYELIEWDEEYSEALNEINSSWCTWQAAKAQAVPEGFVVLRISDVREILSNASDAMDAESPSSVFTQTGIPSTWYDHHLVAEKNILDAIKAQEPTND